MIESELEQISQEDAEIPQGEAAIAKLIQEKLIKVNKLSSILRDP